MGDWSVHGEKARVIGHVALAFGIVAAVFTLLLCVLLTATHFQLKRSDPLNNASLVALRDRYADGEQDEQMKNDIRQLDLLARKAFFVSQAQIRAGGLAAVIGGVMMLLAFGVFQVVTRNLPPPKNENCDGMFWIAVQRSRIWVANGAVLLAAVSVVMVMSTPTELTEDLARAPAGPSTPAVPEGPVSVLPAGFDRNSPIWRGSAGSGWTDFEDVPTEWDESSGKNLLWKKTLELPAWASPLVWDDKVVVLGADKERRAVYCLNAATGEDVWRTDVPAHDEATRNYKTATLDDRWNALVYAGATPAVNGKQVFTLFSNGQLVALDLAGGEVLWNIVPGGTSTNTYGLDNSLLIYKNSVIVVFQGDESFIARYDAATAEELWRTKRDSPTWASPILVERADGMYLVVLPADPDVTAWDPETGKKVWSTGVLTGGVDFCVGPSPVRAGDKVFVNCQNSGMYGLNLSDGTIAWSLQELPDDSGFPDGVSMTTDGKYLYQFYDSVLTCVDAATGKVVRQKELEENANYASPSFNNGLLYLFGDGVALILNADPETDFAEVGKGSIEELSDASPAIVGGRIYLRSDYSVYCFGVKP